MLKNDLDDYITNFEHILKHIITVLEESNHFIAMDSKLFDELLKFSVNRLLLTKTIGQFI